MTINQIHRLAIRYHDDLNALGFSPQRHRGDLSSQGDSAVLCHAMWLCNELAHYNPDPTSIGQEASANRSLAIIQALLWAGGLYTLDDLKRHTP